MNFLLNNFAASVGPRRHHGQPGRHRLERGVGEWVVQSRQKKDIGSRQERPDVAHFPEKLRIARPKSALVPPPDHEQPQPIVANRFDSGNGETQTLSFPARTEKEYCYISFGEM